MEEQMLDILKFWSSDANNGQMSVVTEDSYDDVTKEIVAHFMEFHDFVDEECEQSYESHGWEWVTSTTINSFKSLKELYQYWLTNIYKE